MGTSQKTFDQVRSILGKLDRNIEDVRQRRLGDPIRPALPGSVPAPTPSSALIGAGLNTTIPAVGAPIPNGQALSAKAPGLAPTPTPPPSKSAYGRAQPIRPEARSA